MKGKEEKEKSENGWPRSTGGGKDELGRGNKGLYIRRGYIWISLIVILLSWSVHFQHHPRCQTIIFQSRPDKTRGSENGPKINTKYTFPPSSIFLGDLLF